MKKVDPHKPDFRNLFIKGIAVGTGTIQIQTPQKLQFFEGITTDVSETDIVQPSESKSSKLSLSINDFHLSPHLQLGGTRKVHVLFDYDVNNKTVATEYLSIKNLGSTTIRFYWKASDKVQYFKDIIRDTSHEIYFYFNKNEGLILPGQTIEFPIWFKTREPGTFYEQWEFYTKPNVMPPDTHLLIVCYAAATIGNMNEKIEMIREQLQRNVRDCLIKEILSTVISNVPHNKFKPTVYCYNKREIFETINSQFDILHRRPKYLYNKEVVRELQRFYKRVRRSSDPKNWNYRIEELRLLTRAKQRKEELQKQVTQQEESRRLYEARPKLPKLTSTKTTLLKSENSKHKVSSKILKTDSKSNQTSKTPSKEKKIGGKPLIEQLELIISKLECGATDKNVEQTKYAQAYLILCSCFSRIGAEFEDLKSRLGIIKKTNYPKFSNDYAAPLYYKPTKLVHETLDEVLCGPSLMCRVGTNADKPAPEILKDIPKEDSKRRYRAYYNLPETPPPVADKKGKPAKGKPKADKKAGKEVKKDTKKKEEKPAKTVDSDEDDKYVVNEKFDPYAKVDLPPIAITTLGEQEDEEIESNFNQISQVSLRQYKYNLYVIMYNYLDQAIVNIVDMIEMQPRENLPYPVIKEFEEPKYNRRLIDLKGLLVEETAQEFKARLVLYKYRKHCKKDWRTIEIERQLKCVKSDSSLWSLLRPYETKPKFPEEKPISYPIDHYEDLKKAQVDSLEGRGTQDLGVSTSTLTIGGGGGLDLNWEDFKDIAVQKDYDQKERLEDLEEYIEKIVSKISAQDLFDIKLEKATKKRSSEHVSDEEYFYDSESDIDAKLLSDSSIESELDSEKYEEDSCSCEGLGICNLPIEEECSCEGYGECNFPIEEECSCEGLGECNLLGEEE